MTRLKYCGNRSYEDYLLVQRTHATHIGFIFVPSSKRFVEPITVKAWLDQTPPRPNLKTVGVFVNPDIDFLSELVETLSLDVLQFHGTESPEFISEVKAFYPGEIWKVIHHKKDAEAAMNAYEGLVTGFLIDRKVGESWGGTGQAFDWTFIPGYLREAHRQGVPCFIAGGVTAENVEDLLKWKPDGIDVASGIEENEKKSEQRIQALERKVVQK
ncbi:MAG TPA: phosphoribosylanthranilate isomerase [Sporolactobacillaceae bacterium]|nr:phosphoribosylanthranilate isomerase [Sporolactobacillaceae bacterium]